MSGCYRCGLPEGSDSRLCETCYRCRFHRGLLVVDAPSNVAGDTLELSPRAQTIVLGGGALVYVGIVSFVVTCFGHFSGVTSATAPHEFYSIEHETAIVEHQHTMPNIVVAYRERESAKHASTSTR
jgi:hypothetical protein